MGTAVLIAFGDELLSGLRSEGNCSWLASRFHDAGWKVRAIEVVEDSEDSIHQIFEKWIGSVDLIITSGGLGPTHDDLTRDAVASFLECGLSLDEENYRRIIDRYRGEIREVVENSADPQGFIPELAESIYNPVGSALGIRFRKKDTTVYSFPGVPHEYRAMVENELGPILKPAGYWSSVHIVGWPESVLKERLAGIILKPELHVSILPSPGLIEIVLRGPSRLVNESERAIRDLLPSDCLPPGIRTLEDAVMKAALDRNCSFSSAESCTGGLIGSNLTGISGISRVFEGSAVCYSNSSKNSILGVSQDVLNRYGAVSSECAAAMAAGSRRVYHSDFAVSVTGIAGPDGGTPDKPVGTVWFGISSSRGEKTFLRNLSGGRDLIRKRAKAIALELLWREMC